MNSYHSPRQASDAKMVEKLKENLLEIKTCVHVNGQSIVENVTYKPAKARFSTQKYITKIDSTNLAFVASKSTPIEKP